MVHIPVSEQTEGDSWNQMSVRKWLWSEVGQTGMDLRQGKNVKLPIGRIYILPNSAINSSTKNMILTLF